MTLDTTEQWKLIEALRDIPKKGTRDIPKEGTPEHAVWIRDWKRLLSVELIERLHSHVANRFKATDSHAHDDVVNDVLLRFYEEGLWRYDPDKAGRDGLLGYLRTFAKYAMLKHLRERKRMLSMEEFVELIPDESETNDSQFDLQRFLDLLNPELTVAEREVFSVVEKMVREENMKKITLKEIGLRSNKPKSTVDDIMKRIRLKAQQVMGDI